MTNPTVTVIAGLRRRNELADALINPSTSLAGDTLMSDAAGAAWYLPAYRSAAMSAGGSEAFAPSVTEDGTFTFYLEAVAPAGAAQARQDGTTFALVLDASGAGARFPLRDSRQGAIRTLTVKLGGDQLKAARAALFDANPNVGIEVTQTLKLAAQQTEAFIRQNWQNQTIQKGLIDSLGGIPYDSAGTFFSDARQGDADYPNQYLLMQATYRASVPAPPLPGYVQWQVEWNSRASNYYQDNQDRARVFYLPDRFEFAKGPAGAPTVSLLQFSLPEGPATVERTRATFRLYGAAVVDFGRIENARQTLKGKLGVDPRMVSLEDAHHAKKTFTQRLPNAAATGSDPVVQAQPFIDLSKELRNELDLNFAQFRALWAAIFSAAPENPLFRGWVDVELSDGRYKDRIEFNGRLPGDQETPFFDAILAKSTESTYPAEFTVKTFKRAFQGAPAALEIAVTFSDGKNVTLTESNLEASVRVERSIRDIVIGKQAPDEYPYTMRVVRDDGTISCCEGKAKSNTPSLWLTLEQIAQCQGPCS